jgi:hypothetical protein
MVATLKTLMVPVTIVGVPAFIERSLDLVKPGQRQPVGCLMQVYGASIPMIHLIDDTSIQLGLGELAVAWDLPSYAAKISLERAHARLEILVRICNWTTYRSTLLGYLTDVSNDSITLSAIIGEHVHLFNERSGHLIKDYPQLRPIFPKHHQIGDVLLKGV